MMTITGFPASLPQAEIKGLLETIGKVRNVYTRGPGGSVALQHPFLPLSSDTPRHGRFTTLVGVLHVKHVVLSHRTRGGHVEKLDSKQALLPNSLNLNLIHLV